MRIVYHAEHSIDAHLVRHRLAEAEIEVHITGEHLAGALGELPASGLIRLWVADDDFEAAMAVLKELQNERSAASASDESSSDGFADDAWARGR
jgi:hypothetical protein